MALRRLILVAVIAAMVVSFFVFDLDQYLSFEYLEAQRNALRELVAAHPLEASLAFLGTYVVVTGLSLPGATIMTLAGGAIFGFFWGALLVIVASNLGASLAFLVARFLARDWVQRRFRSHLAPINRGIERDGGFYLFSLRLVPLFPFFLINLTMGLTPLRLPTFVVASVLGMLPMTLIYVYAGTQLAEITGPGDVLSPQLIAAFALLALFPWVARAIMRLVQRRRALADYRRPRQFDDNLIVIGGGSAGLIAALIGATVNARVTLIERDRMGGDCLNTGCVPSKTFIRSATAAADVRTAGRFGIQARLTGVDFGAVMERVQDAIRTIEPHDSVERFEGLGVNCIQGEARLVDPWTVEVNGERRTARRIVLATGSRPSLPSIPGLEQVDPLTSDDVWSLQSMPGRLLVVGAGAIGCELAQAFARLGAQVTLVDAEDRILPREDAGVAAVLAEQLEAEGVRLRLGWRIAAFSAQGYGAGTVRLERDDDWRELSFDRVLMAVGRTPVTDGLGLESLPLRRLRDGRLEVNDFLQTSVPTIYACGDLVGPYQFTHMASHQAWYAAVNALFEPLRRFRVNYNVVPWVTYTHPEVARAGLSEDEARRQGIRVEVTRFDFSGNDRAIAEDARQGFIKVLTPPGRDRILGVAIVGPRAGELLAEYVLAMTHGIGLKGLMGTIHVYPTFAEVNKSVASAWRKAHAPQGALRLVGLWHRWLRG